jgi:ParB family chromosome partitioning protein
MNNHQHINATSGDVEWFTPSFIIEAVRATLGSIELDPASCKAANERVGASLFFGIHDNSLFRPWIAKTLFQNHPFGKAEEACKSDCQKQIKNKTHKHHDYPYYGNMAWINKLESEFAIGHVENACCITFNATSEAWFQPLLRRPICFLTPRTNYVGPDGKPVSGVSKGSAVTLFSGSDQLLGRFYRVFSNLGTIKV